MTKICESIVVTYVSNLRYIFLKIATYKVGHQKSKKNIKSEKPYSASLEFGKLCEHGVHVHGQNKENETTAIILFKYLKFYWIAFNFINYC